MKNVYFTLTIIWLLLSVKGISQNYIVPATGANSITTCGGVLQDPGGSSNYSAGSNGRITIYPANSGEFISLTFSSFALEVCCDKVTIYDGTSTTSPMLGEWAGNNNPGTRYATNSSGALTLKFTSDNTNNFAGFSANISCNATYPLSDLSIHTETAPTTAIAGSSIPVSAFAFNAGATASYSRIGYYLSTDSVYSSNDFYLGFTPGGVIHPSISQYHNRNVTIPSVSTGTYYLLFYVDYNHMASETNENNNVKSLPIQIGYGVRDLVLKNPTVPSFSYTQSKLAGNVFVHNQGNISSNSNNLGLYISNDTIWDSGDSLLSSTPIYTIAGGQNILSSFYPTLPPWVTAGNYYLILYADHNSIIFESNETNNTLWFPLTVQTGSPDLRIQTHSVNPSKVLPGNPTNLSCRVMNTGTSLSSSTNVNYYFSTDSILDSSDSLLGQQSLNPLFPDGANPLPAFAAQIPQVPFGDYFIIFYCDQQNNVAESDENNNYSVQPIELGGVSYPDLVVGNNFDSYVFTVFNNSINPSGNFTSALYLSTDSILSGNDSLIRAQNDSLQGSEQSLVYSTIQFPLSVPAGNYYLISVTDTANSVFELNENNNIVAVPWTYIPPKVDLRVENSVIRKGPHPAGGYLNIFTFITNYGERGRVKDAKIKYYYSADTLLDTTDIAINNWFNTHHIQYPHVPYYFKNKIYLPNTLPQGSGYILTVADDLNEIQETNENNNVNFTPITISGSTGKPDLIIDFPTAIVIPQGVSTSIGATVRNIGYTSCSSFYPGLSYHLSSDTILDASDQHIGSYYLPIIPEGGTVYPSGNVNLTNIPAGAYYLIGVVDGNNIKTEMDETNNTNWVPISIGTQSGVDYHFKIDPNNLTYSNAGVQSHYSIWVYDKNNLSSAPVTGFLSQDSILSSSDQPIGNVTNTYPNFSFTAPTTTGNYYLIFLLDSANTITETNENNNTAIIPYTIYPPKVDLISIDPNIHQTSGISGTYFKWHSYIFNDGPYPSGNTHLGVYLSSDTILNTGDTLLTSVLSSGIATKTLAGLADIAFIPSSVSPGNYYILFAADHLSAVSEISELNNVSWLPLTILGNPSTPTLVPYSGSDSASICSGLIYDHNGPGGNYYNNASGELTIYPGSSGSYVNIDFTDFDVKNQDFLKIYNGNSTAASLLGSYSTSNKPGKLFATTSSGALTLKFESNTISQGTGFEGHVNCTPAAPLPDLQPEALILSSNIASPGTSIKCHTSIFNSGPEVYIGNISIYLSTNTTLDAQDALLSSSGPTVPTADFILQTTTINLSATLSTGNYYIITVTDPSNQITESDETNNIQITPITLVPLQKDFQPHYVSSSPSVIAPGNNYTLNAWITSNKPGGPHQIPYSFYLSQDTIFNSGDQFLSNATVTISNLNVGFYNLNSSIPAATLPGDYYLLAVTDPAGIHTESNENNNVAWSPLKVLSGVDLTISMTMPPFYVTYGSDRPMLASVINAGVQPTTTSELTWYLSQDPILDSLDSVICHSIGTSIPANSNQARSCTLSTSSLNYGLYYLFLVADQSNLETETNEFNNVFSYPFKIVPSRYDILTATVVCEPDTAGKGTSNRVHIGVVNPTFYFPLLGPLHYYISTDTIIDTTDILLGTDYSQYNVELGRVVTQGYNLPANLANGNHYIIATTDAGNQGVEIDETNNIFWSPITIENRTVDLIAKNLGTNPQVQAAGREIGIAGKVVVVRNGMYSVNPHSSFYLSQDTILTAADTKISTLYSNYMVYFNYTLPQTLSPGTYSIFMVADDSLLYNETNENNNILRTDFTVTPFVPVQSGPDLTAREISSSTIQPEGQPLNVNLVAANQSFDTSGTSSVGYYLSSDWIYSQGDTLLSSAPLVPINPWLSNSYSTLLNLSSSLPYGYYYVIPFVDDSMVMTELKENNNFNFWLFKYSEPGEDLVILYPGSNVQGPVTPGNQITVTGKLFSTTYGIIGPSQIGFYLSSDSLYDASDQYLDTYNYQAGYFNHDFSKTLTIPTSVYGGTHYIIYYADYNHQIPEKNDSNNFASIPLVMLTPDIDLSIKNDTAYPGIVGPASNINFSAHITNSGSNQSDSSNVNFFFSSDTIFDSSDILLGTVPGGQIPAYSSSVRSSSGQIPGTATPGNYYIISYADYSNAVAETNDSNNYRSFPIQLVSHPMDLYISNSYPSVDSVYAGGPLFLYIKVTNQGADSSNAGTTEIYLSTDTILDPSDQYFGSRSYNALPGGGSTLGSTFIITNGTTPPGIYYVIYHTDYTNTTTEYNETNNTAFDTLKIYAVQPDLTVYSASVSDTLYNTTLYHVLTQVKNIGIDTAAPSTYAAYLSADSIHDSSDVILFNSNINQLLPGALTLVNPGFNLPQGTYSGNYYIILVADASQVLQELSEVNNFMAIPVTAIVQLPDLVVDQMSIQDTLVTGQSYQMNTQVTNTGNIMATASILACYLSSDMLYDNSDSLIGNIQMGSINPGISGGATPTVTISHSTTSGNYYLILVADALQQVNEFSELNNEAYVPVTVENTSGINEHSGRVWTISPNPSNGVIVISSNEPTESSCEIKVHTTTGKLIYESVQYPSMDNSIRVDFTPVPAGTYVLTVLSDNGEFKTMLVVI